jgi:hypothetical protein
MSHLSPAEFVDLAEGTLDSRRAAHAGACGACRAQAAIVQDALRLTGGDAGVPEPSPLFWNHLSARVREAVAKEPGRPSRMFGWRGFQPDAAVFALAALVIAVVVVIPGVRRVVRPPQTVVSPDAPLVATRATVHRPEPVVDEDHAEVWAVLTAAAADLRLDEAHDAGMAVPPAALERAVDGLTPDELTELARLLQSELKRSSN